MVLPLGMFDEAAVCLLRSSVVIMHMTIPVGVGVTILHSRRHPISTTISLQTNCPYPIRNLDVMDADGAVVHLLRLLDPLYQPVPLVDLRAERIAMIRGIPPVSFQLWSCSTAVLPLELRAMV